MIHDNKNLSLVSLNDSMLSPAEQDNVVYMAKRNLHEYESFWYDRKMYLLMSHIPGVDKKTRAALRVAKHYQGRKVGKHFIHVIPTLDNLKHYGDLEPSSFQWNENFRVARSIVDDIFSRCKLTPIRYSPDLDIDTIFSNVKASAGAIGDGGKIGNWDRILSLAGEILGKIGSGAKFSDIWIPCLPGHRAQIKKFSINGNFNPEYETKDRLIWIVDGATVLVEALYAKNIITWSKDNFYGYAGGKSPDELISSISSANNHMPYWYCTDYSKFDQTIPSWLIHECFNVVRNAYPKSEKKVIDWIEYNFIHTKIALPDGSVVEVNKGIPSGSNFTQFIGSLANYLMGLTYISSTYDGSFDRKKQLTKLDLTKTGGLNPSMFVMGDDNLFFTHDPIDLENMAGYLTTNFGVKVNASKTVHGTSSEAPEFLHRTWYANGCDRDQVEMMLNLVFCERNRTYTTYKPVDILYSLYYTFPLAFHKPKTVMADWFREQFEKSSTTVSVLKDIPTYELPGSARAFSEESKRLYAESFLTLTNLKG